MLALEPGRRNQVMLRLLYIAGLRVSEIAELKWRDLQPRTDGGQVTVFGKGSKTRVVLLPNAIWHELLRFRQHAAQDAPVFASRSGGGHLDPTMVERIVTKAGGLVGRAREAGLAVVLATQGPSDLEAVDRSLLSQVLQDTAWQIVFRQGSPQDAERMQALFGKAWVTDESCSSDGRTTKRQVERWRVSIDEFMNDLQPGDAWLRVAPIDKGWRQERCG